MFEDRSVTHFAAETEDNSAAFRLTPLTKSKTTRLVKARASYKQCLFFSFITLRLVSIAQFLHPIVSFLSHCGLLNCFAPTRRLPSEENRSCGFLPRIGRSNWHGVDHISLIEFYWLGSFPRRACHRKGG